MWAFIRLGVLLGGFCIGVLVWGCNTDKSNPVGAGLVGRNPGQAIDVPSIAMQSGFSFLEAIAPVSFGQREELLVGQMNGLALQSLLRFRVPFDSLASISGGSASALIVDGLRIHLSIRSSRLIGQVQLDVSKPETLWEELQTFIDTLALSEIAVSATTINGATATIVADTTLVVDLPGSYLTVTGGNETTLDVLLSPTGAEAFLLDLVAREGSTIAALGRQPKLEMVYTVGTAVDTFSTGALADTYWTARQDGGTLNDELLVSKSTFFSTILKFDLPTIPAGATVNAAELQLDLDPDRSFFTAFPFEIYHVEFQSSAQDTIYTLYNTQKELNPNETTFVFNQSLVQAWISGAQVNNGLAIRAVGAPVDMTWFVIRNARLKLIYSTAPEL